MIPRQATLLDRIVEKIVNEYIVGINGKRGTCTNNNLFNFNGSQEAAKEKANIYIQNIQRAYINDEELLKQVVNDCRAKREKNVKPLGNSKELRLCIMRAVCEHLGVKEQAKNLISEQKAEKAQVVGGSLLIADDYTIEFMLMDALISAQTEKQPAQKNAGVYSKSLNG
jgi:hypothetical protein